jgi:hypothetical protein
MADDLAALQRRFHALVVTGGAADDLLAGDAAGHAAIYRHMYRARLHGVLATDLPTLRCALGAERFAAIADAYLAACPPRSFTLRDLADRMAGFLDGHAGAPRWAADLARLEWARADVFDAADAAPLGRDDVFAAADLARLVLRLVPASRVVALGWDVDRLWSDVADRGAGPDPIPSPRAVLVWRRGVRVVHRTLDADEAGPLGAMTGGATFAAICERLADHGAETAAARAAELLVRWVDAEVLAAGQPTD